MLINLINFKVNSVETPAYVLLNVYTELVILCTKAFSLLESCPVKLFAVW